MIAKGLRLRLRTALECGDAPSGCARIQAEALSRYALRRLMLAALGGLSFAGGLGLVAAQRRGGLLARRSASIDGNGTAPAGTRSRFGPLPAVPLFRPA